jgi:uncharacterized protein Usg
LENQEIQTRFVSLKHKAKRRIDMPKDPVMLLSYVNQQLRDFYPDLDSFCKQMNISEAELKGKMESIDYHYSEEHNRFL